MQAELDDRCFRPETTPEPLPIKTFIIQTDLLLVKALETALGQEPDLQVVGSQSTLSMVEERVLRAEADVLLLGASPDAIDLTARLRRVRGAPRTLLLTPTAESDLLVPAVVAGASGFLSGMSTVHELAMAIRRAHAGWGVFTMEQIAAFRDHCTAQIKHVSAVEACAKLTARELEVLQILATGASIAETADQLLMSAYTAQTHLKNAMRKLEVTSKLAAVMMVLRAGIVQP
jgi:DNA-binding NarL/FixJ family response regulator